MKRELSFKSNFLWNFLGTSLYSAAQWVLIVGLTHLSSPHVVGDYSLMLALSAPVFLTLGMKLRVAQATDVANTFGLSDYLALQALLNIAAGLLTVTISALLGFSSANIAAIAMLALAKSIEATSQCYYGFFQRAERLDYVSSSLIARSVLGPTAFFVTLQFTGSLGAAILGLAVGWATVQMLVDRRYAQRLHQEVFKQNVGHGFSSSIPALRRLLHTCFPLGIDAGLSSLTINIPRYTIQGLLGAVHLGRFTTLAYLSQIVSLVTSAMTTVLVSRLALYHYQRDRTKFVRLLLLLVGFGATVSLLAFAGAILLGGPLLGLVLDVEYVDPELLAVLMLSAGATTIQRCLCKGLEAARRFSTYMVVDAVTATATLVCAVPMVAAWGVVGAAWSLVGGFLVGSAFVLFPLAAIVSSLDGPGDTAQAATSHHD